MSTLPDTTIGSLWCSKHTLSSDDEKHTVGVLPGWTASADEDVHSEASEISFVLTTKNLLQNAKRQARGQLVSFVDADHTYNLCSNGYPVTVVGTVDSQHRFKLIAMAVSRREDESAIVRVLESIKTAIKDLLHFDWAPGYSMTDRCNAVLNAVEAVFPGIPKGICYFHVKKALKDNKAQFTSTENYKKFEADCSKVAKLSTQQEFSAALELLHKKWRNREKVTVSWFWKEWCAAKYATWFSGCRTQTTAWSSSTIP